MKKVVLWIILLGSIFIGGCASKPIKVEQPTNTIANPATSFVERRESTPTSSPTSIPTLVPVIPELTVIRLTSNEEWRNVNPVWSPDGLKIMFRSNRNCEGEEYCRGEYYVMNADGSQPYQITDEANSEDWFLSPRWSPDGDRVVIRVTTGSVAPSYLYSFQVPEKGNKPITQSDMDLLLDLGNEHDIYSPTWSPDGEKIAFAYYSSLLYHLYSPKLGILDLESGEVFELFNGPDMYVSDVNWSPDGEWIAFSGSFGEGDENYFIYLIKPDGEGFRQLTDLGFDTMSAWSPDSNWIVFSYTDRDRQNQFHNLYLVNVMSGETFQLTDNEWDSLSPNWSPDGKWIAYCDNQLGNLDIYLLDMSWLEMEWDE